MSRTDHRCHECGRPATLDYRGIPRCTTHPGSRIIHIDDELRYAIGYAHQAGRAAMEAWQNDPEKAANMWPGVTARSARDGFDLATKWGEVREYPAADGRNPLFD